MSETKGRTRPFILYPRQAIEDVRPCVLENFGRIKYELPFLNALCVQIPEEKVGMIRMNRRIAAMSEDIEVSKLADAGAASEKTDRFSGPAFTAATRPAHRFSGGEGVSIAVIDTGCSPHLDLIRPFSRIRCFKDFVNGKIFPYDDDGHGTHVCGIAAGNGYSSGKHRGTAPGAALVVLKALDKEGNGNASDILAAMQWIYDYRRRYNIRVLNLSLGIAPSASYQIDPLALGAGALVSAGICVVTAAGNSGPEKGSITSPGISPFVLTVGACDGRGRVADFSSRGPTPTGLRKPDLVAPGVDIVSLSSQDPKGYLSQSGTSMSAPYAAGLAACYCAGHPTAGPGEVKEALIRSCRPLKHADKNAQGHGALEQSRLR